MKKIIKWLREKVNAILYKTDNLLFEHIDEAIMIANAIKRLVNLPATTIIVGITPTEMDNRIAKVLNTAMGEVLDVLVLAEKCQENDTYQARLKCFVEEIRKAHPELQAAIYLKIASLFLRKRTKTDLPASTYDTLIQVKYWENKNAA